MSDSTKRRKAIDDAVDKATAPGPKPKKPKKKNPYPDGSYRAKLWARKQAENQNTDSNNP
jgi:hypothetical protein